VASEASPKSRSVPWHLRGNYAPVQDEVTITDLEVTGAIPSSLAGLFVRNGANPKSGKSPHWFFGDGMLHGVRLDGGKAQWYRNRYVKTTRWHDPSLGGVRPDGSIDREASAANTHVVAHGGKLLCVEEGHFPWAVDGQLETIGAHSFDGRLKTAMTAHPKICPDTGEMLFFGYGFMPPYVTYHRASASGELLQSTEIAVNGPTMMHDFNVTRNYVIFMDLPVVFDLELAMKGTMPYRWDDSYGARLGVMPRNGLSGAGEPSDVRWFDIDPCYVFHPMNAYERADISGTTLVIDVGRFKSMWKKGSEEFDNVALLHRWEVSLGTGLVTETALDDAPAEFARVADSVVGQQHRFGYMVATKPTATSRSAAEAAMKATELLKYDLTNGARSIHDCGVGRQPGEGVFVADPSASDTEEDAGWVMTYVYDAATNTSDLIIVDAQNFAAPPVATVHLPVRVPFGFHGSWVADGMLY
jgi:carotenoid cleavage dioxygenase-like enzyme